MTDQPKVQQNFNAPVTGVACLSGGVPLVLHPTKIPGFSSELAIHQPILGQNPGIYQKPITMY